MYPPAKGTTWETIGGLGAWSNDGQVEITYAVGYGLDGTGGIYGKLIKPATGFMTLSFNNIKLPMFKDSLPLVEPIRSIQFSVDAKLPLNRTFEINLQLSVPKGVDVGTTTWPNRIVLGEIVGTGGYAHYTFSGADIQEKHMSRVVTYIRDLYLNGMTEAVGSINFNMVANQWKEADEFLLDNVKLTITGR